MDEVDGTFLIAGESLNLEAALKRLARYPRQTPPIYDLPGPGLPNVITIEEIRRTRRVSSRISQVQGEWFVSAASSAPWVPIDADLRDADAGQTNGPYDAMVSLYNHFKSNAPTGVNLAKISKVLHLKRPNLFPILDSRLLRRYATAARRAAKAYPARHHKKMYWAAIRFDLINNSTALAALRSQLSNHAEPEVRNLGGVTDLRLLDMLTW